MEKIPAFTPKPRSEGTRRPGKSNSARRREEVGAVYGWECHICELPISREHSWPDPRSPVVEHVVPKYYGGTDEIGNLRLAHQFCNEVKGTTHWPSIFRDYLVRECAPDTSDHWLDFMRAAEVAEFRDKLRIRQLYYMRYMSAPEDRGVRVGPPREWMDKLYP